MTMNKISLIVFLLMSSYLSAAGLYPYASRPKELKPLAPTIFLKEQANEFKLEKSKNAKAAITDWKDLKEALHFTYRRYPEFFTKASSKKTIYEKESKVKINLDSMNWGEIASKNNEAHRIWQQLSQCSNSQDPRQFYFQYDFSDCPRLEDEINSYRKRMLNFLINTKYRSMDISTYDDSFFEVEDRIIIPDANKFSSSWAAANMYSSINYRINYLEDSKSIFTERAKFNDVFNQHVFPFSLTFRKQFPRTKNLLHPFFIQVLMEMSSFVNYPRFGVFQGANGRPKPSVFMGLSKMKSIQRGFDPLEVLSIYDIDLNNYYNNLLKNKTNRVYRDEFGREYSEGNDKAKLFFLQVIDVFTLASEESSVQQFDITEIFPENFSIYSQAGFSAIRMLANLSFLIEPKDFGLLPNQNILFFIANSRVRYFSPEPINYMSRWIAGNLTDAYFPKSCLCKKNGVLLETNDFEVLSLVPHLRFYLSQSFEDMIGLELKE